jgi:hypothetical protein
MEDQGEAETNEQRIFYLHLFMKSGQGREETFVKTHPDQEENEGGWKQREKRIDMIEGEEPESRISPQHQQLTVGDIQHPHHPEDEGKPYGCQAIKASDEDAKN